MHLFKWLSFINEAYACTLQFLFYILFINENCLKDFQLNAMAMIYNFRLVLFWVYLSRHYSYGFKIRKWWNVGICGIINLFDFHYYGCCVYVFYLTVIIQIICSIRSVQLSNFLNFIKKTFNLSKKRDFPWRFCVNLLNSTFRIVINVKVRWLSSFFYKYLFWFEKYIPISSIKSLNLFSSVSNVHN